MIEKKACEDVFKTKYKLIEKLKKKKEFKRCFLSYADLQLSETSVF